MRRIGLLTFGTVLLVSPLSAMADASDYTYLQGDYIFTGEGEIDGKSKNTANGNTTNLDGEKDYDGWGLRGSIAITPDVFIKADYAERTADDQIGDLEFISGGLGMRAPVGSSDQPADLFAVVSYESIDFDPGDNSSPQLDGDAEGYGLTAGIRWAPASGTEISPHIGYVDYGDIGDTKISLDGFRAGIDAIFSVNKHFAITTGYRLTKLDADGQASLNGDTIDVNGDLNLKNEFRIGARFYFATIASQQ